MGEKLYECQVAGCEKPRFRDVVLKGCEFLMTLCREHSEAAMDMAMKQRDERIALVDRHEQECRAFLGARTGRRGDDSTTGLDDGRSQV